MALEDYRVIDYPEKTSVDNTDYVLIDSSTNGTNKYQLSRISAQASAEMAAQVAAEAEAREAADDALQDDIDTRATSAELAAETAARESAVTELKADLTAEQTARENADTALQTAINAKADSTALTAEQTARQNADNALGEDITALSEDVETNYAKIDGYYDSLGVGMADQLASNKYTEDNEPYVYRTSGGTADIGDREYDEIVGGSIVWNQLFVLQPKPGTAGVDVTMTDDGMHVSGTSTATVWLQMNFTIRPVDGHVYYVDKGSDSNLFTINNDNMGINTPYLKRQTIGRTTDASKYLYINMHSGVTIDEVIKPMLIDLTAMFGTAVADAIYALEQAEAGAGVAWFKRLFPKDYYPHNAGELVSVSALQSHDMIGFNQWDEEWEVGGYSNADGSKVMASNRIRSKNYIPVFPSTTYYGQYGGDGGLYAWFYDGSKKFISLANITRRTFTTPDNARYMNIATYQANSETYNHDICINLSWSGWRNGEYEAYDKHSYPLDSSLTLRGIPKVDSAGNLYYDGDTYAPDGTVTRKYGITTITGDSDISAGSSGMLFKVPISGKKSTAAFTSDPNGICDKLTGVKQSSTWGVPFTFSFVINQDYMCFKLSDSITTIEDAKTYLASNPITVVYELATPTTETAQPYASPQIVDDFGTEEYVSTADVRIPVGHNTKYMANLRDKLVHLPNLADSDGAYLIQQTGHTMELVKFRIPKAPTTDGTYTLKATVSGGTPTYTWEVIE